MKFSTIKTPTSLPFSILLHVVGLTHHVVLLNSLLKAKELLDESQHPYIVERKSVLYIPVSAWCIALQLIHIVLSLAVEWQHCRGRSGNRQIIEKYSRIKDVLFRGLVLPGTVLVALVFWGVCAIDRDLVYPAVWDGIIPRHVNHGCHTSTVILASLELVVERSHGDRRMETAMCWSFILGYSVLLFSVYQISGVWFYPFIGCMSWHQLMLFIITLAASGRLLQEIAWKIDTYYVSRRKID